MRSDSKTSFETLLHGMGYPMLALDLRPAPSDPTLPFLAPQCFFNVIGGGVTDHPYRGDHPPRVCDAGSCIDRTAAATRLRCPVGLRCA